MLLSLSSFGGLAVRVGLPDAKPLIVVVTGRTGSFISEMRIFGQLEDKSHRRKSKQVRPFVHNDRQQSRAMVQGTAKGCLDEE